MKGISESIGVWELTRELTGEEMAIKMHVDSSACRGMLLRHGAGKVKHLTTKQLWIQGAIKAYGIEVVKVRREYNCADMLTHEVTKSQLEYGLRVMGFERLLFS